MKKLIQLLVLTYGLVMTSCNDGQMATNIGKDDVVERQDSSKTAVSTISSDTIIIKELILKWNESLNNKDIQTLATIYAAQISLYGKLVSNEHAISMKKDFFKKNTDFFQNIAGSIRLVKVADLQYAVSFAKHSRYSGRISDVVANLIFDKIADTWKITSESDDLTDKNLSNKTAKKEGGDFKTCLDVVTEIVTTSPLFMQKTKGLYEAVVKNGGASYGFDLEGSPNAASDGALSDSKTYDFNLHETYPDHRAVIARFTFNPIEKKLYEYDVAGDKLNPISFDQNLLLIFIKICK